MNSNPSDYDQILELLHQSLFEINCKMESIVYTMKLLGEKNRMNKLTERVLHELEQYGPKSVSELDRKLGTGIAPIQIVLDQLVKQLVVKVKSKRTHYSEGDSVKFYSLNWELWHELTTGENQQTLKNFSRHEPMTWIHAIENLQGMSELDLISIFTIATNKLQQYITALESEGDSDNVNRLQRKIKAITANFESTSDNNNYPDW